MLKNKGYTGAYNDENISVGVLLENPLNYKLEAVQLVFSITVANKDDNSSLKTNDFAFYIMEETNQLHNTHIIIPEVIPNDNESVHPPHVLICTELKPEFLFQDLRIAFFYVPYGKIHIIKLKH